MVGWEGGIEEKVCRRDGEEEERQLPLLPQLYLWPDNANPIGKGA